MAIDNEGYRETQAGSIRVLFCIGVRSAFFDAEADERASVISGIKEAFADLARRFGVTVIGTFDDDEVMVGPSDTYPWTCYILADAPGYGAVTKVCNIVRDADIGDRKMWRYLKIEARLGRSLFFGNE